MVPSKNVLSIHVPLNQITLIHMEQMPKIAIFSRVAGKAIKKCTRITKTRVSTQTTCITTYFVVFLWNYLSLNALNMHVVARSTVFLASHLNRYTPSRTVSVHF